jgi:cytochrome c oxidase assembly protein subunit 11
MPVMNKNQRLIMTLAVVAAFMVGVAYACVPLYSLFCKATGFNGTTQRVEAPVAPAAAKDRWITVSFDGNVDGNLPWDFGPDVKNVRVKLGEQTTITYHARNRGAKTLVGTATFNVQPDKAGAYFDKIQCFCFQKQVLKSGESISLPVLFYIDPAIADDHQANDVQNITLSYTFFMSKDQDKAKPASETKS